MDQDSAVGSAEPMRAGATPVTSDQGDYYPIERLRRQYYDFLGAKDREGREAREARHYYHGSHWTEEEIKVLRKRKQPVITSNRIVRKIDAVVGLVEKLRQDPKAYPRTPQQDEGAELSTAVLRYVLDSSDWQSKSTRAARFGATDGICGVEFDLEKGDHDDPEIGIHLVYQTEFFYDPRSYDEGFSDCRWMGVSKWVDIDLAKELVPGKEEEIEGLMESGGDLATTADADKEHVWINTTAKKVRLVDHWYMKGGKWRWCLYIGSSKLMEGTSPFIDNKGKTFPRFRMYSASVDQDGDRYGFVRNLKSPQDEINHRRSKALHNLNTRRILTPKGAFDDIEVARREAAKPDGVLEYNPVGENPPQFDDQRQLADIKGQLEFLQEAKDEIENFGPNPALLGEGLEDSSGRAIHLLQQAGLSELGPFLSSFRNWKIRVYRDIWNIVTRHWQEERYIRVTDDDGLAQFIQVNKLGLDQMGQPTIVNKLGALDVDIILDEGPDEVNMMADSFAVLQSLGPTFAQQFPEIALELSPIQSSVKQKMLGKIQEMQNKPPPPDPKVMAMQAQAQLEQQKAQADFQMQQQQVQMQAQQRQQEFELEAQLSMRQAEQDMEIERRKAANQIEIERMKAAAGIHVANVKADNDMAVARQKAKQQQSSARAN